MDMSHLVGTSESLFERMLTIIVLFPEHFNKKSRADVISHIQTFRDYFHYHIKASKVT